MLLMLSDVKMTAYNILNKKFDNKFVLQFFVIKLGISGQYYW